MDPIKMRLENRYNAGLSIISAAAFLTFVCQLCGLFGLWKYFPFPLPFLSLWYPYTALMHADSVQFGAVRYIVDAIYCIVPAVALIYLRVRSRQNGYKWMIAAFAAIVADALYVVFDIIVKASQHAGLPLCIVVHFVMLLILYDAIKAGKTIEKGIRQPRPSTPEEEEKAEAQPVSEEEAPSDIICRYDKAYARDNGARKGFLIPVMFVVFFAVMVLGGKFCMDYLDMLPGIDSGTAVIVFLILLVADIAWLIWASFRISVFIDAARTTYTVKPYGQIIRNKSFEPAPFDIVTYSKPVLYREKKDRWIISYINKKGRKRKAVIPKAFPRMAEYFANAEKTDCD